MSINYVKKMRNKGMILLLLMLLLPMGGNMMAQETSLAQLPPATETIFEQEEDGQLTTSRSHHSRRSPEEKVDVNLHFLACIGINLLMVALVVLLVYYPNYRRMDTIFTFILFNITIFLLTFVLNKVKISMGAAFGLFAVFSMLRYRTAGISVKDMTYLFVFIAIGLIGGIQLHIHDTLAIYGVILLALILLDTKIIMKRREANKLVRFERIELILPERREELIEDLRNRTGLDIHRVSVEDIDFLRDCANITVYYYT